MPPLTLSKFCFGLGLTTIATKGLLIWAADRLYDLSDPQLGNDPLEVIGPANILITVMALIGLVGAAVAFKKGASGQLLYASVALNSVALLASPMTNAIW
jgi:hypothetical protein